MKFSVTWYKTIDRYTELFVCFSKCSWPYNCSWRNLHWISLGTNPVKQIYTHNSFCAWKYFSKTFGINWWYDSYIHKLWMKRFPAWFANLNVFNVNLNCTKNIEAKWSTCAAGCRVDHWGCKSCAQSAAYLKFSGSCIKTQKQFNLLDTC